MGAAAESPGTREAFLEKVVDHLQRTVADKLAVLMERQGLTQREAAEVLGRLQARLPTLAPGAAEGGAGAEQPRS